MIISERFQTVVCRLDGVVVRQGSPVVVRVMQTQNKRSL